MASKLDALGDAPAAERNGGDRIDDHLRAALDAADDDRARYHLREALQLQLVER